MLLKYKKIREKKVVLLDLFFFIVPPCLEFLELGVRKQQQQQQQQLIRPQNTATKQRFEECL